MVFGPYLDVINRKYYYNEHKVIYEEYIGRNYFTLIGKILNIAI